MKTANLENCKRLVELGVKLDARFEWIRKFKWNKENTHKEGWWTAVPSETVCSIQPIPSPDRIPAPTLDEILEVLPLWSFDQILYVDGKKEYMMTCDEEHHVADAPADSACLMLIWLAENGHLEI